MNIKDQTPPSITCPADIKLEAGSPSGTAATWTDQVFIVEDIVSPDSDISILCTHVSGIVFAIGTTVVSCSATDEAGNPSANCPFSVIVEGNNLYSFIYIFFFWLTVLFLNQGS